MIMIDFEKAFDSVGFQFIVATLEMFGFGEYFINWIKIILGTKEGTHFRAVTVVNGNISAPFDIKRGCRQGDPISWIPIYYVNGNFGLITYKKQVETLQNKIWTKTFP